MRQHVNPLSRFFQSYIDIPCPDRLYSKPGLPIHLDIGCARGKFLIDFATIENNWNFLGIDIRRPLVDAAEKERIELELNNLAFFFCNANVSIENWLLKLSSYQLQRVSIQFPDPWFKKKHKKRRVFQPSLLMALAAYLGPGAELFLQSDVPEIINQMVELIEFSKCFEPRIEKNSKWLNKNPFQLTTEREIYALNNSLPIYRVLFYRNNRLTSSSALCR